MPNGNQNQNGSGSTTTTTTTTTAEEVVTTPRMIPTSNPKDAVTFKRPEYEAHEKQVKTVNDIYNGVDTAKKRILQTPNENPKDFAIRKEKATLNNFIERIVTTMSGQVFRKPLSFDGVPVKIVDNVFPKIAGDKSLNQFGKDLAVAAIRDGKAYALLDIPTTGGDVYASLVTRGSLINWEKDGKGNYTLAVIYEVVLESTGTFSKEYKEQYRVITDDGNITLWKETKDGFVADAPIVTSYNFVPLYEVDLGDVPPLYDIAVMNINHLNSFSKKDQYLDTAGSPIPFGKALGLDGENDLTNTDEDHQPAIVLGVNSIVLAPDKDASLEWVEMSGQNIEALQDDLERKEKAMSERALTVMSESVKTATQSEAENSESDGRLSDIAEDMEKGLMSMYGGLSRIKYNTEAVGNIIVNRDFNLMQMDSGLLTGLNVLQLSGNLSRKTLLKSLIKNEIVDIEDIDEELETIESESLGIVDTVTE